MWLREQSDQGLRIQLDFLQGQERPYPVRAQSKEMLGWVRDSADRGTKQRFSLASTHTHTSRCRFSPLMGVMRRKEARQGRAEEKAT